MQHEHVVVQRRSAKGIFDYPPDDSDHQTMANAESFPRSETTSSQKYGPSSASQLRPMQIPLKDASGERRLAAARRLPDAGMVYQPVPDVLYSSFHEVRRCR